MALWCKIEGRVINHYEKMCRNIYFSSFIAVPSLLMTNLWSVYHIGLFFMPFRNLLHRLSPPSTECHYLKNFNSQRLIIFFEDFSQLFENQFIFHISPDSWLQSIFLSMSYFLHTHITTFQNNKMDLS